MLIKCHFLQKTGSSTIVFWGSLSEDYLVLFYFWTPSSSQKGLIRKSYIRPSLLLSDWSFLGVVSWFFSKFWHDARNQFEVVTAEFSGEIFFAPNVGKMAKNGSKTGFFEFIEKFSH